MGGYERLGKNDIKWLGLKGDKGQKKKNENLNYWYISDNQKVEFETV